MLRIRLLTVSLAAAVTTASVPARAQVVSDSDFFSISSVEVGLFAERDFEVTISANTKTPMMTMVFPLSYAGHPDLRVDLGAGDQGVTFDSIANLPAWYVRSALVDTTAKTILIGLVGFAMPMPPSVGPVATIHFTLDSSNTPGVVYVDSTFVPPGNHLTFVDESAVEYVPQFTRGTITISDQIPIIRFNLSRVTIRGYADSTSPVSRDFMILNDGGGTLHWTATTDQPWLSVVPDTGTGDLMVSAVADITAMPVGKYTATITVTDPEAINSPKTLPVSLYVLRRPVPADSDYVFVSTAVAPTDRTSRVSIDVNMGTTRWLDGLAVPLSFAHGALLRVDTTMGQKGVTWRTLGNDPAWDIRIFNVDTLNRTVVIGLVRISESFAPGEGPLATIHFTVDSTAFPDTLIIDSTFVPPASTLQFVESGGTAFTPAFHPGAVILQPFLDSLCVTPPEVHLSIRQHDDRLPCVRILVENCGGIGLWGWDIANPCGEWLGTAVEPSGDSLFVDVCGLTNDLDTGTYVCTLTVTADRMLNSPLEIPVFYRVLPPRPQVAGFECNLVARQLASGMWDQATLGTTPGATDGYDPGLDLFKAPPPPGPFVRVSFVHPEWGLIENEFAYDIRMPFAEGCKGWLLKVESTQPGTVHLQAACPRPSENLRWALRDASGVLLAPDFDVSGYSYPASAGAQHFIVEVCGDRIFPVGYPAGWSLMSSPLSPPDPSFPAVFGPEVDLWQFYGWDGGYFVPTEFRGCGAAYWMLLPEPRIIGFQGDACAPAGAPLCVDLNAGWNLVGAAFLGPARIADAQVDSVGLRLPFYAAVERGWVSPTLWGWTNAGYLLYQAMTPGAGYWVPALVEGVSLCLYPFTGIIEPSPPAAEGDDFVSIIIPGTDVRVRMALRETAHDGFDAGLDLPLPPDGPVAPVYWLGIRSDMHPLFAHYYQDVRLGDVREEWALTLVHPGLAALHFANTQALIAKGYALSIMNEADSQVVAIDADTVVMATGARHVFIAEAQPTGSSDVRPWSYYLSANQPNPFNPHTKIDFGLAAPGRVDLTIYNVLGRKVRALVDQGYAAGQYTVIWDGRDDWGREVPSGVYFYRIATQDFTVARKMLLLR